jgi:hypothetical protein
LFRKLNIDVSSTEVAAVSRTSTHSDLHRLRLLVDVLCFLQQALRLIYPSSSSSRMLTFCFQVIILRFVVAGRMLNKEDKKEHFNLFKKTREKAVYSAMKEQRKK